MLDACCHPHFYILYAELCIELSLEWLDFYRAGFFFAAAIPSFQINIYWIDRRRMRNENDRLYY
jgi:hypothetical protein